MKTIFKILFLLLISVTGFSQTGFQKTLTCEQIKAKLGNWKVACNDKTADGFYWIVGNKIGEYGYYGLGDNGKQPYCNEYAIGDKAQTASWKDETSWRTVKTKFCRGNSVDGKVNLNKNCDYSGGEGPVWKSDHWHTGIYEVTCKKYPIASTQKETYSNVDAQRVNSEATVEVLTYETFLEKVWNFEKNPQEWVYEGDRPCIIDFYADWAAPCKMIAPIMDNLAKEYDGKIKIYKIDTDKEKKLAEVFSIKNIPSILFCPMEGSPKMQAGAAQKDDYIKLIQDELLNKNNRK